MADKMFSSLSAAAAAAAADYLIGLQSGSAVKFTVTQLATFVNTNPTFAAGDATHSSFALTSGTVLTSPVAGSWEWDGTNLFFTPATSLRGLVPVQHFIRQHADRAAFANDTAQHAVFDSVANGTLTLPVGAYTFEGLIQCKAMSATSGNIKWSLIGAGGATLANILQFLSGFDGPIDSPVSASAAALVAATSTAGNLFSAATNILVTFRVFGSFECTVAGTIIPSIAQVTATTTAVITAGSYMRFTRIGPVGVVSVGNWS